MRREAGHLHQRSIQKPGEETPLTIAIQKRRLEEGGGRRVRRYGDIYDIIRGQK